MNDKQVFISIVIMSAVTIALRFLPFILFSGKKTPKVISYLGKVLPYAMMGMLVVYCLRDITFKSAAGFVPEILASAVVVVSYVIKKNSLISIISGTVSYMLLVQLVFV